MNMPIIETNIPIIDEITGDFVRYLREEEMSDRFKVNLAHNNIQAVFCEYRKGKELLSYRTKEQKYDTIALSSNDSYSTGFLGYMDVTESDISSFHGNLSLLASVMAVGLASSYYQQEKKFVSPVDGTWVLTTPEDSDRRVTLRLEGKELGTFCFKRIWKNM